MSEQVQLAQPLTPGEYFLLRKFKTLLQDEGKQEWTSDDFRAYGLDRFFTRPDKHIGSLFHRLKVLGFMEPTGKWHCSALASNHGRKIQEWRMKQP